ncbi:MAG TPA: hypothetical protein VL738_04000 [Dactylosporangium sp.]|nr:hypothetical protein [Dactylosporangium sp.]
MHRGYRIITALVVVLLTAGCWDDKKPAAAPSSSSVAKPASTGNTPDGPIVAEVAVRELQQVALKTVPQTAAAKSYLYRRSEIHEGDRTSELEEWFEIQGLIPVKIRENGKDFESRPSLAETAESMRAALAREGPSAERPTPDWLEGLPGDIPGLANVLEPKAGPRSPAARAWDLFSRADPLLPGKVRAGLIKLIATVPGLSASQLTTGGHRNYALSYTDEGATHVLYFDALTARAAGEGSVLSASSPGPSGGPQPDGTRLWTFQIRASLT